MTLCHGFRCRKGNPCLRAQCITTLTVAIDHLTAKVLRAGKFGASQKDVLNLERGPKRYVLARSVCRAFCKIDGWENSNKNAQMSNTTPRACLHNSSGKEIPSNQEGQQALLKPVLTHNLYINILHWSTCILKTYLNTTQLPSPKTPPPKCWQMACHLWLVSHLLGIPLPLWAGSQ